MLCRRECDPILQSTWGLLKREVSVGPKGYGAYKRIMARLLSGFRKGWHLRNTPHKTPQEEEVLLCCLFGVPCLFGKFLEGSL